MVNIMLDLPDIQGIVFSGHGHMPHSRFLCLQIDDRKPAQAWLTRLAPCIVTGERRERGVPKPKTSAHIAFSAPGLQTLGLDQDALSTFPREFTEGMANGERPRVLDDTGDSAPERWQFGGPGTPVIHVLLALYATSEAEMESLTQEAWYPTQPGSGVHVVYQQDSFRRTDNEPFGFRDGISQPAIEGGPVPVTPGQSVLKAGELLLGYTNEYNNPSPVPTVSPALDTANLLPADATIPNRKAFGLNGSFLVLRKLAQDVDGFWRFCEEQTRNPDGTPNPDLKVWLAAKFVGRWPSGAPLTLSPDKDDPVLGKDDSRNNNFLFARTDGSGFACPIGSHVRRSNPRDALEPNSPERALVISNRHRIMRRGRPYEDPLEKGLIFIAFNADIQRQFEFIQQTWINNPKFNGLYDNKDPLVADDDGQGVMVLQRGPVRKKIHGLPRFVQMRGGGYFFLPGLRTLRFLANLA
jgi:Dyp-type peroxidase family